MRTQPAIAGVYRIVSTVDGRQYVGSSKDVERRFVEHRRHYDPRTHRFETLFVCDDEILRPMEQRFLDLLRPTYNRNLRAMGSTGYRHTPEARAKIAAAGRRPCPPETRAKIGAKNQGHVMSTEQRAQVSARHKGIKRGAPSREHRQHLSESLQGRVVTPEARAKMSAAALGRPWTPARRAAHERRQNGKV